MGTLIVLLFIAIVLAFVLFLTRPRRKKTLARPAVVIKKPAPSYYDYDTDSPIPDNMGKVSRYNTENVGGTTNEKNHDKPN